ncbi:MAG TPA: GNAT family N-acetyltransferase [Candidatus Limnocylindrales bacterium]|nr:GNAT family N-acetyltransferase [Candidatus Limnocylindrales bacterium]
MVRADVVIERLQPDDWPAVRAIYAEGIATGDATFETIVPEWAAWDAAHLRELRLVARLDADVVGFAALSAYSSRAAYRGVAWESVYVATARQGQGVGRALLDAVIAASDAAGLWALMAGILAENAASLALHERAGFRRVGVLERIGRDASGRWRDVVLMQRRAARPSGETHAG